MMLGGDFSPSSIVWMFLIVTGGWLLVNAMVDLGGASLRRWLGSKLQALRHAAGAVLARAHDRVVELR